MKENIKIALLAVIAATTIFIAASQRNQPSGPTTFAPLSAATAAASPVTAAPQSTFDPLTPPAAPATPVPTGPSTTMAFANSTHDFGKIMQDSDNKYAFKFTNTGNEPLVITNAVGSCGCTVPDYPKHPIKPGETGEIKIEYKPGKQEGMQNKTVTITANTEPAQTVVNITANVQKAM
ncbi:MAG TPA: DUF1573 domain-containing protein [Flavobacteriales bacterium]|nr:DUF1573 domain-containing protein [Flavobacteriales bacterium]HRO40218.1 DUF1573 domain-containing protein [Flavobacteriales bacterium]HRP82377.1 DUF1573 domain-containing protein [Flavobacteriales bacterium]HRQ84412.1 DUF1573 domain-containing protein [Flavobacteriales bacterium]